MRVTSGAITSPFAFISASMRSNKSSVTSIRNEDASFIMRFSVRFTGSLVAEVANASRRWSRVGVSVSGDILACAPAW